MKWLSTIVALGRRAYAAWRALPADDRKRIEDNTKKLAKTVLKK